MHLSSSVDILNELKRDQCLILNKIPEKSHHSELSIYNRQQVDTKETYERLQPNVREY